MKKFLSAQEAADLLGISKVSLIKKIKSGEIYADKAGNAYVINPDELPIINRQELSENQRATIESGVGKVIDEYSETLRLLKDT